jgi:hypothetical protein
MRGDEEEGQDCEGGDDNDEDDNGVGGNGVEVTSFFEVDEDVLVFVVVVVDDDDDDGDDDDDEGSRNWGKASENEEDGEDSEGENEEEEKEDDEDDKLATFSTLSCSVFCFFFCFSFCFLFCLLFCGLGKGSAVADVDDECDSTEVDDDDDDDDDDDALWSWSGSTFLMLRDAFDASSCFEPSDSATASTFVAIAIVDVEDGEDDDDDNNDDGDDDDDDDNDDDNDDDDDASFFNFSSFINGETTGDCMCDDDGLSVQCWHVCAHWLQVIVGCRLTVSSRCRIKDRRGSMCFLFSSPISLQIRHSSSKMSYSSDGRDDDGDGEGVEEEKHFIDDVVGEDGEDDEDGCVCEVNTSEELSDDGFGVAEAMMAIMTISRVARTRNICS